MYSRIVNRCREWECVSIVLAARTAALVHSGLQRTKLKRVVLNSFFVIDDPRRIRDVCRVGFEMKFGGERVQRPPKIETFSVSSASLRSPLGRRAIGRVGARRFDAAGVSNAAPTGTVAKGSVGALQGDVGDGIRAEPGEATMARLSPRAAPRHLVSMRRAPCHRHLPAWCVCVTHRGCLLASHRWPARARRRPARLRGRRP